VAAPLAILRDRARGDREIITPLLLQTPSESVDLLDLRRVELHDLDEAGHGSPPVWL
jgi:hypothetical protein